ncbi:MAG: hypothetical protein KDK55_01770 [Chlamydiia bacterium]|nr:hypothetical protein [Chlamydiia bacterium]
MGESTEKRLRSAMEELLAIHGVELSEDELPEEEQKALRLGDYSAIAEKTQEKLDELNEKAEILYKKLGMTPEDVAAYSSNPDNFTPEQWEALRKVKEEADNYKKSALETMGDKTVKQIQEASPTKKKKKGIHRFGKKKNWIPS